MRKIILRDVLLRESDQVEGGAMSPRDQLNYVQLLIEGGIDEIEVGYPSSTAEQLATCKRIIAFVDEFCTRNPKLNRPLLSGLSVARKKSIDAVAEAGLDICHIYIPASDELLQAQFGDMKYGETQEEKRDWVIRQAAKMVKYAKSLDFKKVQYSPEDAGRTGKEYLLRVVSSVASAGVDYLNIPDTTGHCIGSEFRDLIKCVSDALVGFNQVEISVHCHNDYDHSVPNAIQAVLGGATQIEGTFYGLGERSGMTKFESVLLVMSSRKDIFEDFEIGFKKQGTVKLVNFLGNALGMPVPRHWPVVGIQNGICSSGTHQAIEARAKEAGKPSPYYGWDPKSFGHESVKIVINKSSGRIGIGKKLRELGFLVAKKDISLVYDKVMEISEAKGGKEVEEAELIAIAQDVVSEIPFYINIDWCQVVGGRGTIPTSTVKLEVKGEVKIDSAVGDGTIDAIMKAVLRTARQHFPALNDVEIALDHCSFVGVTKGSDALADFYCRIRVENGEPQLFAGRSVHLDTSQAAAQSFANCISWFLASKNGSG